MVGFGNYRPRGTLSTASSRAHSRAQLPHCQSWAQLLGDGAPPEEKTPSTLLHGDGKGGKAGGNPKSRLSCRAAGVAGPGRPGRELRSLSTPRGAGSSRAIAALSRAAALPGWSWSEEQPSFPATTFQVSGDCRRGREERGAGFVCLAQPCAVKQITANAAEGSTGRNSAQINHGAARAPFPMRTMCLCSHFPSLPLL